MQTKQTEKLARRIRKLRERKKKGKLTPWRVVCEKFDIRTEDGRLDPGLAYKIGYRDFEPSGRAMRHRLHLKDICTKCRRVFRKVQPAQVPRAKSAARAWFDGLRGEDREKVIEISYRNFLKWKSNNFG